MAIDIFAALFQVSERLKFSIRSLPLCGNENLAIIRLSSCAPHDIEGLTVNRKDVYGGSCVYYLVATMRNCV